MQATDTRNQAGMANKALVGEKVGMTQVWDDDNRVVPVTVVKVAPLRVVQIKTPERDGYSALQVTFGDRDARKLTKPEAGHFAKAGVGGGRQARRAAARRRGRLRGRPGADRRSARGRRARRRHRRQPGQGLRRHDEAPQLRRPEGLARHAPRAPQAGLGRRLRHARPGCSRAPAWPAGWVARRSPPSTCRWSKPTPSAACCWSAGAIPGPKGGLVIVRDAVKAPVVTKGGA